MKDGDGGTRIERRFTLRDARRDVEPLQTVVLEAAEAAGYDQTCCFAVRLALEEALSNAFHHGNRDDPAKAVTVQCRIDAQSIEFVIEDEGEGFDPGAVPDPTAEENLEIPAGRGLILMRAYMSEVTFDPPGNRVRMTFRRTEATRQSA